ncbi:hypothetical protein DEA98_22085 [Brucella pseudogrignonensis]|uniref:Uncharacterized protein n=2 Tax=Brucella pseudogrignonensis TaxID=419475 RepID=A0A7Y3T1L2_9HYPH|nr:hypothetical protein [Brucella pseudogrignonensis]NNV19386.1 hypothetical protein [Brucella pseudogrignonensis]
MLGAKVVQRDTTRQETLAYIEEMLQELVKMARGTDSYLLVYLMDMALQEARDNQHHCPCD